MSGTPPEDMLAAPVVVQVAGDRLGRFFRPASGDGEQLPAAQTGGRVLEGYHWGLFTSGSLTKALWFLLLPFGMVNAAAFMLPARGPRWAASSARAVLRLLGLALTAVFVLGTVQVLVYALAWAGPGAGDRWALAFAVAGCLAVLGVITLLGRGQVTPPPPGQRGALPQPGDERLRRATGLAEASFYVREPDAPLLRRVHVSVGLLVIALPSAATAVQRGGGPWVWLTGVLLGAAAVVGLLMTDTRGSVRRLRLGRPVAPAAENIPSASGAWEAVTWTLLVLAAAALVVDVVLSLTRPLRPRGLLPGFSGLAFALVLVGLLALLALLVVVVVLARVQAAADAGPVGEVTVPRPYRPYCAGTVAWVVAALGTYLGLGFTVGVGYAATWLLARRHRVVPVPEISERVAYCWGVAGIAMLLLAAFVGVRWLFARGGVARDARAAYARPFAALPEAADDRVWKRAAAATWTGSFKFSVGGVGGIFAVLGLVLCLGIAGELRPASASVHLPGPLDLLSQRSTDALGFLVGGGNLLLAAFAGGLLLAGRGALLRPSARRVLNVVWDVIAFWPREVHPIAPPPYSQRAVRDLADRITWHLENGAPQLLLAGHSQGSLICAAALLRVPADLHPRIGLVTHGSQLQFAYARGFPGYVNPPFLRSLLATLSDRWVNLFRTTDPLGGPVLSWDHRGRQEADWTSARLTDAGVVENQPDTADDHGVRYSGPDWRLLDPPVLCPQEHVWPGTRRHSDYYRDEAWSRIAPTFWPDRAAAPRPRSGGPEPADGALPAGPPARSAPAARLPE